MNQYCFIIGNPALSGLAGRSYNNWSLLRDLDFLEISLADFLGDGGTTVVGFRVNYLKKISSSALKGTASWLDKHELTRIMK